MEEKRNYRIPLLTIVTAFPAIALIVSLILPGIPNWSFALTINIGWFLMALFFVILPSRKRKNAMKNKTSGKE